MAKKKSNTRVEEVKKVKEEAKVSAPVEVKKEAPAKLVWVKDINFGQHKVGDEYKGNDQEALLAKGWIK